MESDRDPEPRWTGRPFRQQPFSGRNLFVGAPWGFGGSVYLFRENGPTTDRFMIHYEDRGAPPYPPLLSIGGSISADGNTLLAGADGYSGLTNSGGIATILTFRFGTALMYPFVRTEDHSFHFRIIEAEAGQTYVLETAAFLGSEWRPVTEIFAEATELRFRRMLLRRCQPHSSEFVVSR